MDRSIPQTSSSGPRVPDVKYDSSEGRALSSRILAKYLPYEPHDYQLDGICPVMDGFDLLVTTPTGSGKTGYLIMLMLVVRVISADATLALGEKEFPKDPAMIIVCPTKALEDDMVCAFWWSFLTNIVNIQKGISNAESRPDGHRH
jgi:ATP-dependent helicase YprA (DUF1998 family)